MTEEEFWVIFFSSLYVIIQIVISCDIILSKHEYADEATMWLLAVLLLPGLGILLYLFFGIGIRKNIEDRFYSAFSKLDRKSQKKLSKAIEQNNESLQKFVPDSETMSRPHNRMLDRMFPDNNLITGNSVEMLCDGTMVYPRMLEDIANAKHTIRLASFILMSDKIGNKILTALAQKAKEGVDVKVMFDSFGSFYSYFSHFFQQYLHKKRPNLQILAFSPMNLLTPWTFQLRNHRKVMVIDGRIAYSGGINISEENEDVVPSNRRIHDLHCRIEGPAVPEFTKAFFFDWAYTTRRRFRGGVTSYDYPPLRKEGDTALRIIRSLPGKRGSMELFFCAAAVATKSLYIMTPYLVPGQEYIKLLCLLAQKGVEVKIIVPQKNNHFFVDYAAKSFYTTLLKSGVHIYEKVGIFSHTKAALIDGEWGFMGSSNCDNRSFKLNFELDFCFENGPIVQALLNQFYRELEHSEEVLLHNIENKKIHQILAEDFCSLLSPIL